MRITSATVPWGSELERSESHSMKPRTRASKRFGRRFVRMLQIARNPLSVIPLLLFRGLHSSRQFRVGNFFLSARRTDLGAVSEIAIEGEYGFVKQLTFPRANALFLDIGANIGCFSALVFSTCVSAEVHSMEPSPDTFAVLSENRARYPFLAWHLHRSAVSAETGTSRFHNEGPSGSRKLSPQDGSAVVDVEAFDSFVTRIANGRRVFLCKMDVEGAEVPIFSGMMRTLTRIEHFIVEVHGPATNARMITEKLAAAFPHVRTVSGRSSPKAMIHAWRTDISTQMS